VYSWCGLVSTTSPSVHVRTTGPHIGTKRNKKCEKSQSFRHSLPHLDFAYAKRKGSKRLVENRTSNSHSPGRFLGQLIHCNPLATGLFSECRISHDQAKYICIYVRQIKSESRNSFTVGTATVPAANAGQASRGLRATLKPQTGTRTSGSAILPKSVKNKVKRTGAQRIQRLLL
jgi:hypothetical protein